MLRSGPSLRCLCGPCAQGCLSWPRDWLGQAGSAFPHSDGGILGGLKQVVPSLDMQGLFSFWIHGLLRGMLAFPVIPSEHRLNPSILRIFLVQLPPCLAVLMLEMWLHSSTPRWIFLLEPGSRSWSSQLMLRHSAPSPACSPSLLPHSQNPALLLEPALFAANSPRQSIFPTPKVPIILACPLPIVSLNINPWRSLIALV